MHGDIVDWIYLEQSLRERLRRGDLVSGEAGGLPIYRVMSVERGRAWLRDVRDGSEHIRPLEAFPWKAEEASERSGD